MDGDRDRPVGSHRQFEVLVVCTANLCRSPMLQGLLAVTFASSEAAWSISSAGTHATPGRPVHPSTARALAEHGATLPDGWTSRQLDAADLERADLVLTASRSHRSDVVRTAPRASSRTFTVRQFLRLLATPDVEVALPETAHPGELMLETALAARGLVPPASPELDDIPDPVGRPYPVFRDLAATLAAEVAVLSGPPASIRPTPPAAPPEPASARPALWWASRSS